MSERIPAEAFPLGEIIADELEARGWSTADLAKRMGGDPLVQQLTVELLIHVNDLDCLVGDRTFSDLALAFGISEEFFRNIDTAWRRWAWHQKKATLSQKGEAP